MSDHSLPGVDYSRIQPFTLTPVRTRYRFQFMMEAPSDFNARVVFNAGALPIDVFLDHVSLRLVPPGDFNLDGCVNLQDLAVLTSQWRRDQAGLLSDLNGDGKVDFKDVAILGENWIGGSVCVPNQTRGTAPCVQQDAR